MKTRPTFKRFLLNFSVFILLGISNLLIKLVSFKKLVRLISNANAEAHIELTKRNLSYLKVISQSVASMSKHTPWRSMCFEQALTASFILKAFRIPHGIYFGLNNDDSELKAHAWLMVNNLYVTGAVESLQFTAVSAFYYNVKKK